MSTTVFERFRDPRSPLRPRFSRVNSSEGAAPLAHLACGLFKQAEPSLPSGMAFSEPPLTSLAEEPIAPSVRFTEDELEIEDSSFLVEDPAVACYPLTPPYEESNYSEIGEEACFTDDYLEDDWNQCSPASNFSDEWEEDIEWRGEYDDDDEQLTGSGTVTPTTPAIIDKLDSLASNIRSLSVWDTSDEMEESVPEEPQEHEETSTEQIRQFYSEFEIVTNPLVFQHKYLIIPEAALNGIHHLSRASNGFFNLKSYTSLLDTLHDSNPESWKLWLKLQNYSVDSEAWDDPILKHPDFFNLYATLVFVERPGMFSRSGEPIYEFIGNFYVRRHDAVSERSFDHDLEWKTLPRPGSFEQVPTGLPYLSASFVILQFVEEPCIR